MPRAVVLHSAVGSSASVDEADTYTQIEAVEGALVAMGYTVARYAFVNDYPSFLRQMQVVKPELVFNLVESVNGSSQDIFLAPLFLERAGLRFSGCSSSALYLSTGKIIAKRIMLSAGVSTAPWFSKEDSWGDFSPEARYIIKPSREDASIGIGDASVARFPSQEALIAEVTKISSALKLACFAEQLIPDREFNISVIGGRESPQVLPIAEINFTSFWDDKVRILGYKAKWDVDSKEYQESLPYFPEVQESLRCRLQHEALACWRSFGLNGYARLDVRVAADGTPFVLEVNADPGISPGAGFVLACEKAGISYQEMIFRIVSAA